MLASLYILLEHDRSGHARMRYTSSKLMAPVAPDSQAGAPCVERFETGVTIRASIEFAPDRVLIRVRSDIEQVRRGPLPKVSPIPREVSILL